MEDAKVHLSWCQPTLSQGGSLMRLQGSFYTTSERVLLPAIKSVSDAAVRNFYGLIGHMYMYVFFYNIISG